LVKKKERKKKMQLASMWRFLETLSGSQWLTGFSFATQLNPYN
jgi:hypothetical protein